MRDSNPYQYLHNRHYGADGRPLGKGGWTVAYEYIDGNIRYAFAECSKEDNFDRRLGRTIAAGRLKKGFYDQISIEELGEHYGGDIRECFIDLYGS